MKIYTDSTTFDINGPKPWETYILDYPSMFGQATPDVLRFCVSVYPDDGNIGDIRGWFSRLEDAVAFAESLDPRPALNLTDDRVALLLDALTSYENEGVRLDDYGPEDSADMPKTLKMIAEIRTILNIYQNGETS